VIRNDFSDGSDVDILVEFLPESKVGLSFFSLQEELSQLVGRPVDLSTPGFLSPRIREKVASEARPVYEAA
jgi:predicted nucleotidyltransferase